jgi:predicted regulator of Ras-like GTPase activity (Roadblock/LC7/MglB family)
MMPDDPGAPRAEAWAPAGGPSRAAVFRQVLQELVTVPGTRGALIVAPDGLVIASELSAGTAVEPLGAMAATLGREMELGPGRAGAGEFSRAIFVADDGSVLLGASPVGFVVALGDGGADVAQMRTALRRSLDAIQAAWRPAAASR